MSIGLGTCDAGRAPPSSNAYFGPIHEPTMSAKTAFRGEADDEWIRPAEALGSHVLALQRFLKDAGFMPFGRLDGICGYRTVASLRLFQEYVRSVEREPSVGPADGVCGPLTLQHVQRWQDGGIRADWTDRSGSNPTQEYTLWLGLLGKVKQRYLERQTSLIERIGAFAGPTDTVKVQDWSFAADRIHLVGVRRGESEPGPRRNDDVFVLLVNGIAFKFFGTTDPGKTSNDAGAPFLVPGQHRYRFGWHKMTDMSRVYRALKPATAGVLVIRDGDRDAALTDADLSGKLESNDTINVHWGGRGVSNWSEGCQVICGKGYINHQNTTVDCTPFAALRYVELGKRRNGVYMTKGAYSVLVDLVTAFSGDVHAATYMLLYEQDLEAESALGREAAQRILDEIS